MVYEFPSLPLMVIFFGFCRDARTSTYYKRYKKCKKKIQVRKSKSKSKGKKNRQTTKQTKTKKRPSKMLLTEMLWSCSLLQNYNDLRRILARNATHILTVSSKPMIQASEPGNGLWSWWLPAPEGKVTVIADWRGTIIGLKSLKTKHNKDEIKIIINYYWQR